MYKNGIKQFLSFDFVVVKYSKEIEGVQTEKTDLFC